MYIYIYIYIYMYMYVYIYIDQVLPSASAIVSNDTSALRVRGCTALYFYRDGFVFQAHRLLYHST